MATGSLDTNGIWQYGEDDSEPTFSALLNKLGSSTSTQVAGLKQLGRVVQSKTATRNSAVSTTSTSYVDVTGVSVSITPRATSNKILVRVTGYMSVGNATAALGLGLFRNTTLIGTNPNGVYSLVHYPNNNGNGCGFALEFLDSPATTSATTYKLALASLTSGVTVAVGGYTANIGSGFNTITSITVEEIAA
jgi:hypothetical protein